jgi:hypothetical protein
MSFAAIGIGIGAIGLTAQIFNGINQSNEANQAMNNQTNIENQQLQTAQTNETNTQAENNANNQEKNQESVLASMGLGKQGWAGTILTSPLGVPTNSANAGTTGGKQVLGQ